MTADERADALARLCAVGFTDEQAWALAGGDYDVIAFTPVFDQVGAAA